jgi:hypothetical protein
MHVSCNICIVRGAAFPANILYGDTAIVAYEDSIRTQKCHYRDHQLVAAYWSWPKASIQLSGESLQEFAVAVEHLAHWAPVRLLKDFIQREAASVFIVVGIFVQNIGY